MKTYSIQSTVARHLSSHISHAPKSPFKLIQEDLQTCPWKLLVCCILLNQTRGESAKSVIQRLFIEIPDPNSMLDTPVEKIEEIIKRLGLGSKRADLLKTFTYNFLHNPWSYPAEIHGIGKYADDCYRIFCCNEIEEVQPDDHMLRKYLMWRKNPLMNIEDLRETIDNDNKNKRQKTKGSPSDSSSPESTRSMFFEEKPIISPFFEQKSLVPVISPYFSKLKEVEEKVDNSQCPQVATPANPQFFSNEGDHVQLGPSSQTNAQHDPALTGTEVVQQSSEEDLDEDEEIAGWKITVSVRQSGATAGRKDFYYISPRGNKCRSLKEVEQELPESNPHCKDPKKLIRKLKFRRDHPL